MNQRLINLIIIGQSVWLLISCATQNSKLESPKSNVDSANAITNSGRIYKLEPTRLTGDSPFNKYDSEIINSVEKRWYDLLESQKFETDRKGKVIVQFKLKSDGSVTDIKIVENNVGELLGYITKNAITKGAPFAPWPVDMERMVGKDYREFTFNFYYQ